MNVLGKNESVIPIRQLAEKDLLLKAIKEEIPPIVGMTRDVGMTWKSE